MGTKIHGEAHDISLAGVDLCTEATNLNMSRTIANVRTNCGLDKIPGEEDYNLDLGGPLEFGAGSTEATLWAQLISSTAAAWELDPKGTGTPAADNPIYSGTTFVANLNITVPANGQISYASTWEGTDASGLPTRDITP